VGSPTQNSLLEEVGSYTMASDHLQQEATNGLNAAAQIDDEPFEIDGICCFNFQASAPSQSVPETPWTPALVGLGVAFVITGAALRRRRGGRVSIH
jgi:hypothetical protein